MGDGTRQTARDAADKGRTVTEPLAVQAPERFSAVMSLQRAAGNAAVTALLLRHGATRRRGEEGLQHPRPSASLAFARGWASVQRAGDFEIGGRLNRPGQTDTIFFDRRSSTIPASETPKIAASIAAFGAGTTLFLDGYASEEEPASLALDRATEVSLALNSETPPHTGGRTKRNQSALGGGRIDYRELRKVQIQPPAHSSGGGVTAPTPSAPASETRPCGAALANCKPRAKSMLTTAIAALGTPDAATNAHLRAFFGSGGVAAAGTIKTHLTNLKDHIINNVKGSHVHCHTELDAGCGNPAYNVGTGASAVMTLCPDFLDNPTDIAGNAETLIHEAGHGTTGLATRDIAYGHTRLIHALTTSDALANTDSYVLLVRNLVADAAGVSGPAGGVSGDVITGLSAANTRKARVALAHMEKWLTQGYQDVAGAYEAVHEAVTRSAWTGSTVAFDRETVRLIAPLFGLTDPGTSAPFALPTAADREKLAAIHDRFLAMRSVMWSTGVTIRAGSTSRWSPGPGATVTLAPAFFGLADDVARIRKMLFLIADAHPDISAGLRWKYVTAANRIRMHRGLGP
jgi:hypothetical protein